MATLDTLVSISVQDNVSAALGNIDRQVDTTADNIDRLGSRTGTALGSIGRQVEGIGSKSTTSLGKLTGLVSGIRQRIRGTYASLNRGVRGFHARHATAIASVISTVPGANATLATLANPYALAATAATGAAVAAHKAYVRYQAWETQMAKLNVTTQLNATELSSVSDELLRIGADATVSIDQVPHALNKIVSAGVELPTAMEALPATLQAAKAGFTDVGVVAGTLANVMNSSGVTDATEIYDTLFATMNRGNAEFADISQYLPKIVPSALQVGSSLGEVSGAYAFMTAQGQTAERSAVLLENAFKVLGSPEKAERFGKLGVAIYDTAGNLRALDDIARDLDIQLDGLSDAERARKLASLGLDMEAASAFSIMAADADKLGDIIGDTTNASGNLAEAVRNSATSSDVWQRVGNRMQVAWIKTGEVVEPFFTWLGEATLGILDYMGGLVAEGTLMGDVFGIIGEAIGGTFSTIGNVLGYVGTAVSWVTGKLGDMYTLVRPLLTGIGDMLGGIWDVVVGIIGFDPDAIEAGINRTLDGAYKASPVGIAEQYAAVLGDEQPESSTTEPPPQVPEPSPTGAPAGSPVPTPDGSTGGSSGGRGSGARNVTVRIEKIVLVENLVSTVQQSKRDLERQLTEILARSVRDAEIAVSR